MLIERLEVFWSKASLTQKCMLLFCSGASFALCFAPFHLWPVGFAVIPLFAWALHHARTRWQCVGLAFAFGYGFSMAGTYWIAFSLLVDAEKFAWLLPFSILGLSAVMALWFALLGLSYAWLRTSSATGNLLLLLILYSGMEYVRSVGIFGFPWNLVGYIPAHSDRLAQIASLVGIYGLSLLALAVLLTPALYLLRTAYRLHFTGVAVALVLCAYGYGMWRMPETSPLTETTLRIVQPNIAQSLKWTPEGKREAMRVLTSLSRGETTPDYIIWPESALPFTLHPNDDLQQLRGALGVPQRTLIAGSMRAETRDDTLRVYNSIVAFNRTPQYYDKRQLVPFGEFVPFRNLLPIEKITGGNLDFSRGKAHAALLPENSPVPLICYEVIFPHLAHAQNGETWLLTLTNDAWFGNSPGPYQHYAMAKLRAVEQGLPLVRSANTGISAVIDAYGREHKVLGIDSRGVIDSHLPAPAAKTLYSRYGNSLFLIMLLGLCVAYLPQIRSLLCESVNKG